MCRPDEGHSHCVSADVDRFRRPADRPPASQGVTSFHPIAKDACHDQSTDPFSASIIPFEVPEQMRAFAEKGVSQARDNYAKFKDAAETHNGTIEAVFTSRQQGRQRLLRQADGIHQGQHHRRRSTSPRSCSA